MATSLVKLKIRTGRDDVDAAGEFVFEPMLSLEIDGKSVDKLGFIVNYLRFTIDAETLVPQLEVKLVARDLDVEVVGPVDLSQIVFRGDPK